MPRLSTLWFRLYHLLCWVAVAAPLALKIHCDLNLITPRSIGGTLFGGAIDLQLNLAGWALCTLGLALAVLIRMPGARLAWLIAGVVPLILAAWWRINYPDDADGNLIFSTQDWELDYMMVLGLAWAASGLYLLRRQRLRPRPITSTTALALRTLCALILAVAFILAPLLTITRKPLPYCAFDRAGKQLSLCLGPGTRVIVD
ncbi:MAG: hypothetical protein ACN6QY_21390 [Pseudomonas sp.]|uniref:hypothetical protein n=1 Tax=Pseudomonas sp. TaxID=306 RepID=UPI00072FA609|nr:hypothetical protein AO265_16440 [Pseudomonas sp. ABAC61]